MFFKRQSFFHILWPFLLWRFCRTKAEFGICNGFTYLGIYCNCVGYKQTSVSCIIINVTMLENEAWDAIAKVDNIEALTLRSRSKLNYIPSQTLEEMKTLEKLTFNQGSLGDINSYSLSRINSLKDLDLEGNEITSIKNHGISNLPKLRKLTLSDNLLQELLANTLTGLDHLEELYLDRNNITRIESCAFCELQSLRELELWGNRLTDITEYTFRGLRYLKRLDLNRNEIKIINDKVFQSMPKLQEIDLRLNLISHISPRTFNGLEKLQILALNGNQLKSLPDEVFKSLPHLQSIELVSNLFETLQAAVLDNAVNAKDQHFLLTLKENPLKCDCRLQWVNTYLDRSKSHQFKRELEDLKCMPSSDKTESLNITDFLTQHNCKKAAKKPRILTTSLPVTKITESVPIELLSSKSKVLSTEDSAYVSDIEDDDDKEVKDDDDEEKVDFSNPSGSVKATACFHVITGLILFYRIERLLF